MKLLFTAFILLISSAAFSSELNCRGDLEDGVQVNICKNVIDTKKLATVNCNVLEDGYSFYLCQNARHPISGDKLDCLNPQDGAEVNICSAVPKRNTVSVINCLEDLEDGYAYLICTTVNVQEQKRLQNRLKL